MKNTLGLILVFLFFGTFTKTKAQISLVKKGRAVARIVTENNAADLRAAELLQSFVCRMTHVCLSIAISTVSHSGDIIIGQGDTTGLIEDGFRLITRNGKLFISSGGDKGSIYGVVTLLEKYLGVSYYAANTYTFCETNTLNIPYIEEAENPAFRYRQCQNYAFDIDPVYRLWFRLEEPQDVFVPDYWVHTFSRLVPPTEFGLSHPEYYALIEGVRHPGSASQLCLSNPDVLEIIAHRVDSIFKVHPGMKMISVSQNDGNDTYCTCPACSAIDAGEGGPTGSLIYFINKLASRFPDKEISTLAYQYSMQPPLHSKPLSNVNIMLCNIDCRREVPLTDNASGREFVKAIEGWSKISNNLFIWDYGINFDNYLVPFPNFRILQNNIRLFKKNHATMIFSQVAGSLGGDFSEMRTYMLSKLMWNPELNTDSLMRSFMDGYYGAASPYIYQYEILLEGALLASGIDLWIYDTALSHKTGMLNSACRNCYNELFDSAEKAVSHDKILLDRVRKTRLSLQYADLEMARTEQGKYPVEELKTKLDLFQERATYFHVPVLNERSNTIDDYCRQYIERYFPERDSNLAYGAEVTWLIPPEKNYLFDSALALTDGYLAGNSSKEPGWIGWQGSDGAFILNMKEVKEISSISTDFIHHVGQWSLFPKAVNYSYSVDGRNYYSFGRHYITEERRWQTLYYGAKCTVSSPVKAQYIKVEIESQKTCPGWHFGAGHPSWFFLDEVTVL